MSCTTYIYIATINKAYQLLLLNIQFSHLLQLYLLKILSQSICSNTLDTFAMLEIIDKNNNKTNQNRKIDKDNANANRSILL